MSTAASAGNAPTPVLWSPAFVRIVMAQGTYGFGWCLYVLQPKFMTEALRVGPRSVGTVGAVSGGAAVLTIALLLRFIDRRGGRRVGFLTGSGLLLLSSLGYLTVREFGPLVYLLQAGIAASYVLAFNSAMALVTDIAPPTRMGQAFGIQSAANLGMNAVSSVVAESVSTRYGWHGVFAVAAVAATASFLVGLSLPNPPEAAPRQTTNAPRPPYAALLPAFVVSAVMGAAYSAMVTFHQPYALSLGAKRLRAFFIGFTTAALLMRLVFGGLGDRIGHRRAVLLSLGGYALVTLAAAWMVPSVLWAYGAGLGLAHGVAYPTLSAYATEHAPRATRGRVIAVISGSFNVGSSIGAFTWGYVAAHAGFPALFVIASLTVLFGLITLGLTKPPEPAT